MIGAGILGAAWLASKAGPKVVAWFKKYFIINEDDNEVNKNILRVKAEAAKAEVIKRMKEVEDEEAEAGNKDMKREKSHE